MKRLLWRVWLFLSAFVLVLAPLATPVRAEPIVPESVASALGALDGLVADAMGRTGVPGVAVVVVYREQVVYLKGFGVRETGTNKLVDPDTVFQLASVSKPIASTVIAGLVGDGLVHWEDRIVEWDPGFRMHDDWVTAQVTLRDMFSHRSGLPDHAGDLLEDLGFDRATILSRLRYLEPEYSFRAGYAYTNFGLTEAALAAAKATGKSWEDLSAERLYRPLGMRSTSSRFADYLAAENRALLHVKRDGEWVARATRNPDAQIPAGGVSSSVRDLAQWLRLHLNAGKVDGRQIVSADAMNEVHRPEVIAVQPPNSASGFASLYGLGWNVGNDGFGRVRLTHSGAFGLGAATSVTVMPGDEIGMAVLSNGEPVGVPEAISAAFFDLVNTGKVSRDWVTFLGQVFAAQLAPPYGHEFAGPSPASPAPARPAAAYSGVYRNDYLGEVEVAASGGDLVMRMGPLRAPFVLRHWNGDTFYYIPPGENGGNPAGATFTFGQGVATLVLENFDVAGASPLVRIP